VKQSAPRALAVASLQFGVRSDVQVRLVSGLHAPRTVGLLPAQAKSIINRSHEYFHASWVSPGDMTHSLEICRLSGFRYQVSANCALREPTITLELFRAVLMSLGVSQG
jgi:hypothetical protein